jgi:prephenate dehydratase
MDRFAALTGRRYGLVELRSHVEDVPANWTRFVVMAAGG